MSNVSDLLTQKRCSRCERTKDCAAFGKNRSSRDGLDYYCRGCRRGYARSYYAADPARGVDAQRQYRLRHPKAVAERQRRWREENQDWILDWRAENIERVRGYRRVSETRRRAGFTASPLADKRMLALRETPCVYCGACTDSCADHVIAIAAGGPHVPENLVAACRSCNASKGSRPLYALRSQPADLQLFITRQGAASAATWTLVSPAPEEDSRA